MKLLYSALTIGLTIAALAFIISILPNASDYPIPADILGSFSNLVNYLQGWNFIVDWVDIFIVLKFIVLPTEVAIIILNIILWIKASILGARPSN